MQNILMPNIYFMLKNVSAVKLKKKNIADSWNSSKSWREQTDLI